MTRLEETPAPTPLPGTPAYATEVLTEREMDALPIGTVVLSRKYTHSRGDFPISFQRWHDGLWHRGARAGDTHPDNIIPATVLHRGSIPAYESGDRG